MRNEMKSAEAKSVGGKIKKYNKYNIKIILLLLIFSLVISPLKVNALSSLDQQIREIEDKIKENKTQVNQKKAEVSNLQSQVNIIDGDIASTQKNIDSLNADISAKQKEIERLQSEIKQNEERILKNKDDLKKFVQLLYEKGNLTTVEILASTSSVTDFLNQEEYNRAIQDKINSTIGEIKVLKSQLEMQKKDQETKKASLQSQKDNLEKEKQNQEVQKKAKAALLSQKYSEQQDLEQTVKIDEQERNKLVTQRKAMNRGNERRGGSGGYPYYGLYPQQDAWGFYQRECVSYAAWYWNDKLGKNWYNTQSGRGSAKYWPEIANTLGYSVSSTPQVGAIMVWTGGRWGHVAIVEKVYGNGTVHVSDYNYYLDHNYGERDMSTGGTLFIY